MDFKITTEQAEKFALAVLNNITEYITEHREELEVAEEKEVEADERG